VQEKMRGLVTASVIALCSADVYMHNPRGSNDRNCERNVNRNNGNRLFDSQNNAKGGYACPRAVGAADDQAQLTDKMFYYEGSWLPIEWTSQHGCGDNDKVNCEIVLQYACEDTLDATKTFRAQNGQATVCADSAIPGGPLEKANPSSGCIVGAPRDGQPTNQNDAATDRIPLNRADAFPTNGGTRRYGMHETYDFYEDCRTRGRNRGLFTADQNVNGNDATRTRQNPNGNRNGLECPEERDYYPYWHPTPWKDVAIMTNKGTKYANNGAKEAETARCNFYRTESQNVKAMGECVPLDAQTNAPVTGVLAKAAKATIKPNNGARRWYNNNEKPPGAQEAIPNNEECKAAAYQDSCWCAKNRGEPVAWIASQFALGYDGGALAPPDCVVSSFSRANQLGNAAPTEDVLPPMARADGKIPQGTNANRYLWQIPQVPAGKDTKSCVLRLRYNISTSDYTAWADDGTMTGALTASSNGRRRGNNGKSPIQQDPYVTIRNASAGTNSEFLSLALNTNQYSRTFQDRSYVFEIRKRPTTQAQAAAQSGLTQQRWAQAVASNELEVNGNDVVQIITANSDVVNLNVRGKRGNIVQTYPSVEYDFVPNDIQLNQNDFVHFQWTGSDYNPRRGCNNGEGGPPDPPNDVNAGNQNSRADRTNMVDMTAAAMNYPADITGKASLQGNAQAAKVMFNADANGTPHMGLMRKMSYLDQTQRLASIVDPNTGTTQSCLTETELNAINNKNRRENHPRNCAKLNAANTPYFNGGAVQMKSKGQFSYFSSRNNNFSNRDQTGRICVGLNAADCQKSDNPEVQMTEAMREVAATQQAAQTANPVIAPILDAPIPDGFQEKDNDALGDGEAFGCEGRMDGGGPADVLGMSPTTAALVGVACTLAVAFVGFRVQKARVARGGAVTTSGGTSLKPGSKQDTTWLKPASAAKDVI
jgi:hypothetical protein